MVQAALTFSNTDLLDLGNHFHALTRYVPLGRITSAESYNRVVAVLDGLMDAGASDEDHPLAGLLGMLGEAVADYDEEHHSIPVGTPIGALRFLMDQHGLRQGDLTAEIGSQGVVSEILNGRRTLNVNQVARLAARFGVAPGVFITL